MITVILRDKDNRPLAVTDDPDAAQRHNVDSLKDARQFVNGTRYGYYHDDSGEPHRSKVTGATIIDGSATDTITTDHPFFR